MPGPVEIVPGPVEIVVENGLTEAVGRDVTALLERAEHADAVPALNEAGWLSLRRSRPGVRHLRALRGGATVGYAQLEDLDGAGTAQVVVDPPARRSGVGAALVDRLLGLAGSSLQLWAIGDRPAAAGLARAAGLVAVRTLLIMTRPLADVAEPRVPAGIAIDAFRPGRDEQAWLAVNGRAFAHHPEQGAITAADLADRVREPWFDPAGFFLARAVGDPEGPVLGFHWTKRHGQVGQGGSLGEVYVLGVDPDAQGKGLAKALLLRGLAHLRACGDTVVELYVEADSARAVGLYDSHGFRVTSRDVMYGEPAQRPPSADDEAGPASP